MKTQNPNICASISGAFPKLILKTKLRKLILSILFTFNFFILVHDKK